MCWLRELPGNNKKKRVFPSQSTLVVCEHLIDNSICVRSKKKEAIIHSPQWNIPLPLQPNLSGFHVCQSTKRSPNLYRHVFLLSLQNGGWFFLKRLQPSKEHYEIFILRGNWFNSVRLLSDYKMKGYCGNKQTNKHMLILLLISLVLDLFLEWVL